MIIIQSKRFREQLSSIDDFIRSKSKTAADGFLNALYDEILSLEHFPYKFRKSYSYNDENIRDCIFKSYVIPYLIDKDNDTIVVLAIFRENIYIA